MSHVLPMIARDGQSAAAHNEYERPIKGITIQGVAGISRKMKLINAHVMMMLASSTHSSDLPSLSTANPKKGEMPADMK